MSGLPQELIKEAQEQIEIFSANNNTDKEYPIFVLGPYEPDECKKFLKSVCMKMRIQKKYTAFLLDDLSLSVTPDVSFKLAAFLSIYNLFVIPKKCGSYGWVSELTELLNQDPRKLLIFYRKRGDIPFQLFSKMINTSVKHGPIIDDKNTEISLQRIATRVTTALLFPDIKYFDNK